jgi:parallel beta-helix repeat protein
MKKEIIGIFICMLFVGGVLPVSGNVTVDNNSISLLNGTTLYVGGDGPGNYTKIQDAINDASDGDTVYVFSGLYKEETIIIQKSLHLIGEDKNTTILEEKNPKSTVIAIYSENVRVEGFTIKNIERAGIYTFANNATIVGNIFLDVDDAMVIQNDYHIIENNMISSRIHGIYLQWSNESYVSNNIISECSYGIIFFSAYRNTIYGNILKNNSVGVFVWSYYARGNNIIKNNFENNKQHASFQSEKYFRVRPKTNWNKNYWGSPRVLPMPIYGKIKILIFLINWIEVDWQPAREPYDIEI